MGLAICKVRERISGVDGGKTVPETCREPGITLAGDGDRTVLAICKVREIISVRDGGRTN